MKLLITFLFFFPCLLLHAQPSGEARYWVYFSDKAGTAYSLLKPEEFLSPAALDRREKYGISLDQSDLPVNKSYVEEVRRRGHKVFHLSKWFNAALILADSSQSVALGKLPFIEKVEYVGPKLAKSKKRSIKARKRTIGNQYSPSENHYGYGALQIGMVRGHILHLLGYRGKGMRVGVFDGGFSNVDIMPFFDSLRAEGRLIPGRDFVDADDWLYESSQHGSQVLSTMGANLPGLFVGTAPDATYLLCKTEDTRRESWTEECNWIAAAEWADSAGVDIITSSLGYTTFSEKWMNYAYKDMNGRTSRVTRGAEMAFSKGMIVVNSAGNEGNSKWRHIGAPADAPNVFAIGAVDPEGNKAPFSSLGPSYDGRIKPNVSAMGHGVIVASISTCNVVPSSGTSFSAPLTAGMVTSLWQAFPDRSNAEILQAIEETASLAEKPNDQLGFGIPDFWQAFVYLAGKDHYILDQIPQTMGVLLPTQSGILLPPNPETSLEVEWFNPLGQSLGTQTLYWGLNKVEAVREYAGSEGFLFFRVR
jgi:serine protease AprX